MTRRLARMFVAVAFVFVAAIPAFAHEGLHEQIETITARIQAEPQNAALYLKRGELYRLHTEWALASADFDRAEQLDPQLAVVAFARGRMLFESGNAKAAKPLLDRFLREYPLHAEARLTRARVLVALKDPALAAADYDSVIAAVPEPSPDLYFERAGVLASRGGKHIDDALRSLDQANARLGFVVSLQLAGVDIAVAAKRYDEALRRLDVAIAQSQNDEALALRKGEILELAGRRADALAVYVEAVRRIEQRRASASTTSLANQLQAAAKRTGGAWELTKR